MAYRHFRLVCILRVMLLCATAYLFFYLIFQTTYYATLVIVGAWTLYQVGALIHYVERTNRDLTRFLQAIRYEDFSQSFSLGTGLGSTYTDLKEAFNEVLDAFRKTRADKEEHFQYLHTVVQHIGIGLICFANDGRVELINTAALRLLRRPHVRDVRELESFSKPLVEVLLRMRSGEKSLVKVDDDDELLQLVVYATELRMRGETFTLASVQNIQSELEEQEMEAWQKLIRVLTHEIMNSITPISSLASTVRGMIPEQGGEEDSETLSDVHMALETIESRSQGLLHFVETYRELTRIPKPDFKIFAVSELFSHIVQLMNTDLEEKNIVLQVAIAPETLELTADPDLVEQVLINLLRNASQALTGRENARIDLTAQLDRRGRVVIRVRDNGPGILAEVQERIFIPFFTTKREGSGIGLSLSRQIMRVHRGTISVQSELNKNTVFTLR
ncbi:MAG: ATP-binding protein, partial [Candidatus Latescibacteria bacterium]|nr:ATP-binding protein [Candidatus Latescibacterota bacterium]